MGKASRGKRREPEDLIAKADLSSEEIAELARRDLEHRRTGLLADVEAAEKRWRMVLIAQPVPVNAPQPGALLVAARLVPVAFERGGRSQLSASEE
jgi:hypothetical protein